MKHSVKRILALALMFVMIAALGTTAMATTPSPVTTPIGGTVPAETDTATVQIKGFSNENVTVKAYQIVKANYFKPSDPQQGFAGYEVVEDAGKDFMEEIKDSNGVVQTDESGNPKYRIIYPTSNDISRLAQSISALGLTAIDGFTLTPEGETYTATKALGAGESAAEEAMKEAACAKGAKVMRCDMPAMLMTMGLALMITCQALISMLVAVGLGPVTGQPLPLISRGGTSVLITSIYFGIMMSVSREQLALRERVQETISESQEEVPIVTVE